MEKSHLKALSGYRDIGPEQAKKRREILEILTGIFSRFDFQPLETPTIERGQVLERKYGGEADKLIQKFKDKGGRDVALRYDLTVPLARYLASHQTVLPFKRYQIGQVFRAEKPQAGRYREFTQCDFDTVGAPLGLAEVELLNLIILAFEELMIPINIKINDRAILNEVLKVIGTPLKKHPKILQVLDKREKIGSKKTAVELEKIGLLDDQIESLIELAKLEDSDSAMAKVKALLGKNSPASQALLSTLKLIRQISPDCPVVFDFGLARGFDYYTGLIIEVFSSKSPAFGSLGAGGRYDNLISQYVGRDLPAIGFSFGLDRIEQLFETKTERPRVLIAHFKDLETELLLIAKRLREQNIDRKSVV